MRKTITYNGITKTASEWAETTGLSSSLIRLRLHRGWSIRDALTIRRGGKRKDRPRAVCDRDCLRCKYGDCIDDTPWPSRAESAMTRCGMPKETAVSVSAFERPHVVMLEGRRKWMI